MLDIDMSVSFDDLPTDALHRIVSCLDARDSCAFSLASRASGQLFDAYKELKASCRVCRFNIDIWSTSNRPYYIISPMPGESRTHCSMKCVGIGVARLVERRIAVTVSIQTVF